MDQNLRLDLNFQSLLFFAKKYVSNLGVNSQVIARKWMDKLMGTFDGLEEKRNRNVYLSKLVFCMESGSLVQPFLFPPLLKAVPTWESTNNSNQTPNSYWSKQLSQMSRDASHTGGRNYRSYLSTKQLPNGSCAYIALSVINEGESSSWMHMKDCKIQEHAVEGLFEKILQKHYN